MSCVFHPKYPNQQLLKVRNVDARPSGCMIGASNVHKFLEVRIKHVIPKEDS